MNYLTDKWGHVFLNRQQAAAYLDISPRKLATMIAKGIGPMPLHFGTRIYFLKTDLDIYKAAIENYKAPLGSVPNVVPDCSTVDGLVTEQETAKALGLAMRTLAYRRAHGMFPLPVQVGKQRRYRMEDLAQYLTFLRWKAKDWVSR